MGHSHSGVSLKRIHDLAQPKRRYKADRYLTQSGLSEQPSREDNVPDRSFDFVTPGPDYKVQQYFGKKSQVSNVRNSPSFGMLGRSDSKNKLVISLQHKVDMLGKDSPKVGLYNNNIDQLYKIQKRGNIGSMAFSKASRFKQDRTGSNST